MDDPDLEFRDALRAAGFYAPATENMGAWRRITACTQGPPGFKRLGGRSFWVGLVKGCCYVGTWGSHVYRLPDSARLLQLTCEFLRGTGGSADFSRQRVAEYGLERLNESERDRLLPDER